MKTKTRNILLAVPILAVFLIGGGYAGYRGYKSIRQTRLINQARSFMDTANEKKAILILQRALSYDPKDPRACRLVAELMERGRSPAALLWRSRVVEYNPGSLDDRLALAQTAMTFRDYASATNALEGVSQAGKKSAAFHNIAGVVASAGNRLAEAEAHFLEAARLEPTNPAPQLNLAVIHLKGTNAAAQAEARAALARLSSSQPGLRCQALRELIVDAMRYKQTNAAFSLSKDLVLQTNSPFSDRLLRLDVLLGAQDPESQTALAAFQRDAGTNLARIYELARWQMSRLGPTNALAWLSTLPHATQTNQTVEILAAECEATLGDWKGLQASLQQQHWGDLEFLRRALLARALRGLDLATAANVEWELALKAAAGHKESLVRLLRLAAQWNWKSDAEQILWTIVNRYPAERWAFQTLSQTLFASGQTRPLMTLYSQELKRSPSAPLALKNDLAMTALLLDAKEMRPNDLAREVYEVARTNASCTSTYAFSLYTQGKTAAALQVIQQLKPSDLENPSVAGYYGLILKATGDVAKARTYLDYAFKAPLLPEERKLFENAKGGV